MNWSQYYRDLPIPKHWIDVSYSNDVYPSFQTSESEDHGYIVFIDSYDTEVRADNTEEITGKRSPLLPRFTVSAEYGVPEATLFTSDDFNAVLEWIVSHPKATTYVSED